MTLCAVMHLLAIARHGAYLFWEVKSFQEPWALGRPKSHQPVVDEAERGFGFHLLAAGHLKPYFQFAKGCEPKSPQLGMRCAFWL